MPAGREAGVRHRVVVVTAQRILNASPSVIQVLPLTTTLRRFGSEVIIEADPHNGLTGTFAAQCQHVRSVSPNRVQTVVGQVGAVTLAQIRETLAVIFDLPS